MNNTIPDGLPTLAKGFSMEGSGTACVMQLVSVLAGEKWSDFPECTNYVLASYAQSVNDMIADADRHRLLLFVPRLLGTDAPVDDDVLRAKASEIWDRPGWHTTEGLLASLSSLIDEYDRLAGRTTHRTVTPDDLRTLAATVAGGAS